MGRINAKWKEWSLNFFMVYNQSDINNIPFCSGPHITASIKTILDVQHISYNHSPDWQCVIRQVKKKKKGKEISVTSLRDTTANDT